MAQQLSKHMDNKERFLRVSTVRPFWMHEFYMPCLLAGLYIRSKEQRTILEIRQAKFSSISAVCRHRRSAAGGKQSSPDAGESTSTRKSHFAIMDPQKKAIGSVPGIRAVGSQCQKGKVFSLMMDTKIERYAFQVLDWIHDDGEVFLLTHASVPQHRQQIEALIEACDNFTAKAKVRHRTWGEGGGEGVEARRRLKCLSFRSKEKKCGYFWIWATLWSAKTISIFTLAT